MSNTIKVLDHGYVTLRNLAGPTRRAITFASNGQISPWGRNFDADDTDVANAARKSFDGSDKDRTYAMEMALARYLMVNKHMTPFEMIQVWLEIKMPIFVARQFVRHRTQAIDEVSARYVTLPADWYIPEVVGAKPVNKKQGQSPGLDDETQDWFKELLEEDCHGSYQCYIEAIDRGVAPEHARMFLHMNHYTSWITTMNLRNMLGFLVLRDHSHAQIEAQMYAKAITTLLEPHIPGLMKLYREIMREEI